MKRYMMTALMLIACFTMLGADDCNSSSTRAAEDVASRETASVARQVDHLLTTQPVPTYDYSLQRDVLIQIYGMQNEAHSTYTTIDTITGQSIFSCPSVGFGIPADTSLTNPLVGITPGSYDSAVAIDQAEPNGLYSSKNTDGTWIVCVTASGALAPIYTEHKVTTFPFQVYWTEENGWLPVDGNDRPGFTVAIPGVNQ